ncbi:TolC family protein [Flavobacterium sp. RNTU_13]|uniref:TolC family protein n=1 Tax=Flavobacterium sp. RNTU_13 TaxID=3375145 RepID=UPI003988437E
MCSVLKSSFIYFLLLAVTGVSAQSVKTLSLQDALKTARGNNLQLKAAKFNINIAEADVVTASLRPNLQLNNQSLQMMASDHYKANTQWYNPANRQVWWQLTKTLQIAGQRANKIDFAQKNTDVNKAGYAETERAMFADVATKWLEVWNAQRNLKMINYARQNVDSVVIINKVRLKNQVVTETDFYRTQLLSKQYTLQYTTAKQELNNKLKELMLALGTTDSISVKNDEVFPPAVTQSFKELLDQASRERTDLKLAVSQMAASESNIKLQKSMAIPQPQAGLIYNPQNTVPYAGIYVTIDLPFFDRNQGEIKKSQYLRQQAEQQYTAVQQQVNTELSTAYNSYRTQQQNIEGYKAVLKQSSDILSNVKYAYLKGGTTVIDFLEAQRSWLDVQQQYNDALYLYHQSYIQLLYSTGLINNMAQ